MAFDDLDPVSQQAGAWLRVVSALKQAGRSLAASLPGETGEQTAIRHIREMAAEIARLKADLAAEHSARLDREAHAVPARGGGVMARCPECSFNPCEIHRPVLASENAQANEIARLRGELDRVRERRDKARTAHRVRKDDLAVKDRIIGQLRADLAAAQRRIEELEVQR